MRTSCVKNGLVMVVILLFIGFAVNSSIGISTNDDMTPPVTTCTFDPSEPDGLNGWYLRNVTVELTATDDMSGVREIRISMYGGPEIIIPGNYIHLFFDEDCKDYFVDYWAIDIAGNVEPKNRFYINIDRTAPDLSLTFEFYYHFGEVSRFFFTAYAQDSVSGIDHVDFYLDDEYQETIFSPGPEYDWIWTPRIYSHVVGFILKPEITEEYMKFYALFVRAKLSSNFSTCYAYGYDKAGNMDSDKLESLDPPYDVYDFLLFQDLTLSNNYEGHIGRFFINSKFNTN